jgi:hypothetical protein
MDQLSSTKFSVMVCLSFFILNFGFTIPTYATESALSASPAILESVLELDKPSQTTLTIQNNTNFPLPIKGSVSAFLSTETIPEENKDTFNASRWFSLDPSDFILQPNELKKITVTITPPAGAEPGGHYATIYFRPLIPQEAVSAGGNISLARIGILAMMIVPGDITTSLKSSPLTAPAWSSFGPIKFWSNLTNNGSVHLLPSSTLTIKNFWGQTVAELKSDPTIVLPHTTKEHNFVWDTKLGIGPYRATLTTTYGTDEKPIVSDPVTTYLLPWPIIVVAFAILTFVYKIFIVNRRRIVLAISVLKGTYEPPEVTQKNTSHHPRLNPRSRSYGSPNSTRGRPRRQSNRRQSKLDGQ